MRRKLRGRGSFKPTSKEDRPGQGQVAVGSLGMIHHNMNERMRHVEGATDRSDPTKAA